MLCNGICNIRPRLRAIVGLHIHPDSDGHVNSKMTDGPPVSPLGDHMTRNDDKGDQPSGGEPTWTNTRATQSGRGKHKTGQLGGGMLRPSSNHGCLMMMINGEGEVDMKICAHKCYWILYNPIVTVGDPL